MFKSGCVCGQVGATVIKCPAHLCVQQGDTTVAELDFEAVAAAPDASKCKAWNVDEPGE